MLTSTTPILQAPLRSSRSGPVFDHYRCAPIIPGFSASPLIKEIPGFFRFGPDLICYGQSTRTTSSAISGSLFDVCGDVRADQSTIELPFEPNEVLDNLRYERYANRSGWQAWVQRSWLRDVYYSLRPMLSVSIRKHLQKVYLRDWDEVSFPGWPVDRTADLLLESLLVRAMQSAQVRRLPFIWFWPEGHQACAIVTHDVETTAGRDFCERLMDIDDAYQIKASFQVVPEERYTVPAAYLQMIKDRGFEVNVQGLNHDGNLFRDRETFLKKAKKINYYAEQFEARGFRSPILYRNIEWFQDLQFSYDMSVPNAARLDPQRGGCCTVMPYFLPGGMTELPLTTTQDYSLFHILHDYSASLWKQQMRVILKGNGLMSFIAHPDYLMSSRAEQTYRQLLEELSRLRLHEGVWITLPKEVDRWWRERSEMELVANGSDWELRGAGRDRARIAYACLDGERLTYEVQ
jgi:peptidoglycan/xylan/chitin deacetylase (PgdA/CDA1 family)